MPAIDVQAVLAAVAGADPVGADLRAANDADFTTLRERVDEAQRRRRSLERGDGTDTPDWQSIVDQASQLLASKTKDIQVLSWMIEASARAYGLEGLTSALEAAAGMVSQFLPQMHPRVEPGDEEFRLRPLIGLDNNGTGTLIPLIQQQPIIGGGNGSPGYNILHQQQATSISKLDAEKRELKVREGAITLDHITRAAAKMQPAQAAASAALLDRSIRATESLRDALLKHCGGDAPPTSAIIESLQACRSMLETFAKDKLASAAATNAVASSNGDAASGGDASAAGGRGTVNIGHVPLDRESILTAMGRLVTSLDVLEPQNLAVPAFQQAIAWARMDRVALLSDLLGTESGDTARDKLFRLIGLKPPPPENKD